MGINSSNRKRIFQAFRPSKLASVLELESLFSLFVGIAIGVMFKPEIMYLLKQIWETL